jgi:hypothetical protein
MTRARQATRRDVLHLGAAAAVGAALSTVVGAGRSTAEPAESSSAAPTYLIGSFVSAARGGVETTSRVAFMGWSRGGYGALRLGASLGPARTAAICAVSPALWTSYSATEPGAFDDADAFARNAVFGLPALSAIPLRIDCGTSDRFYPAARQFATGLRRTPAGGFWPGGHDVSFWKRLVAADLTWIASLLTG